MFGLHVDKRLGRLTTEQQALRDECSMVVGLMGQGLRLLVPKDGTLPHLIADPRYHDIRPDAKKLERKVSRIVVQQLIKAGSIGALTEFRNNQKLGWREACLSGKTNHVYFLVQ
jgi:hypothetical protein